MFDQWKLTATSLRSTPNFDHRFSVCKVVRIVPENDFFNKTPLPIQIKNPCFAAGRNVFPQVGFLNASILKVYNAFVEIDAASFYYKF